MISNDSSPSGLSEKLLTLKQAHKELGLPYYKLLRAARAGLIPTYRLLNDKKYVRASEILHIMATKQNQ